MVSFFEELPLYLIRNVPTQVGMLIRRYTYTYAFSLKSGKHLNIDTDVTIKNFKNILIGDNVFIGKGSFLYGNEGYLKIGNNSGVNTNVQLGASNGELIIGDNVIIGANSVLRSSDHNYERIDVPIREQGHVSGKIEIEDDVWIGSNVVITSNVKIGRGSIIGAGSVVTHEIPPLSIAAGVPARVIKQRK